MNLKLQSFLTLFIQMANGFASSSSANTLPASYHALVAEQTGQSFSQVAKVRTLPIPSIGKDEVLVKVKYAGVNGGCETFRARGEHAFEANGKATASDPFGLGAEGVGTVAAIGSDVTNVEVGDPVCFVGESFAEYSKSKASMLWKLPCDEPLPEHVGLRISGLTSCAMLEQTGKIQPGEKVLITAAAGGAGHFAVQFAKLAGCVVIGTCGSARKEEVLKSLGCDHVINYKTQNVSDEIKRLAPNGLDAVLEGVGGSMLQIALDNLAEDGRLLQVGYISEYPHNSNAALESSRNELKASELFWNKETIQRGKQVIYGNAWPKDFSTVASSQDRVLGLFAEGKIKSIVDDTDEFVGLESVSNAIDHMLSGKTIGKVVVRID
mmetsp:Transcript_26782/g.61653  ORF Transcript_26782/g.61653 Transcript_26782/m.61653 type:complete len:380 (-) Transcript_26782:312-1451(-)